jgi:putative membrane protein
VFFFEKGADYYAHNAFFIAKISLFVAIALLSIYPTREFLSWRKGLNDSRLPAIAAAKLQSIRGVIHLELAGIALILLCAALMAKGIGSL